VESPNYANAAALLGKGEGFFEAETKILLTLILRCKCAAYGVADYHNHR
jgi:hypothetical protein